MRNSWNFIYYNLIYESKKYYYILRSIIPSDQYSQNIIAPHAGSISYSAIMI